MVTGEPVKQRSRLGIVVVSGPLFRLPDDEEFVRLARAHCFGYSLNVQEKDGKEYNAFKETSGSDYEHPGYEQQCYGEYMIFDVDGLKAMMVAATEKKTKLIVWEMRRIMAEMDTNTMRVQLI